ncbi:ankyrin [Neocallimastix lanati (nom. inval.)]|nr:ankyrin [Neocallimastix sp. JGI-2020a]
MNNTNNQENAKHGEDINKVNYKYGERPLFYACESGNKNLIKFLLEYGADINKENVYGQIPLSKACKSGNKDLQNINKEDKIGETPLFYACERKNKDLVVYLVENGADIIKENKYGERPLFKPSYNGNKDIVEYLKYLIEHGVDRNKKK